MNRIMIAGTGSDCGKTTVTCAILSALKSRGEHVISFKAGPDYIDPMFHKKITGIEARNLDVFLMGEENVKYSLQKHNDSFAVIEGVMGLYDGIGSASYGSANHLSQLTNTPVVLVVNVKGKSQSVCAEIQGYLNYEKNNICGVILNNVTDAMYTFYRDMIEEKLELHVFGFMPNIPDASIKSRHLGLVTAEEIADLQTKIDLLADAASKHIDIALLRALAREAGKSERSPREPITAIEAANPRPIIYVAMDKAFCFCYEDNHDLLRDFGAELRFFSPLHDETLPNDADGLVLWGGYPELYALELQDNASMRASLLAHIQNGLPVYAECGGFMYLQETLIVLNGDSYAMLGVLDGTVTMTSKLQNFGYITLEACEDNLLCKADDKINAHSFHHSVSSNEGENFVATKKSTGKTYPCIVAHDNIFGGYPHIHFMGNPKLAQNFVKACSNYKKEVPHGVYNKPDRD